MKTQTKKVICLLVAIVSILTIVSAVSYAYFTAMADVQEQSATLTTGTMNATFSDGNAGISATLNFGESVTKTFTIQNTGTLESTVQMYWENLVNTYTNGSLTYTLSYSETENGTYTNLVTNRNVPVANSSSRSNLATDIKVPANTTYYYRLVIKLNYLENINQDADVSAKFSTKFAIGNEKLQTAVDKIIASSKGVRSDFSEAATTDEGVYEMADDYGTSYYFRGAVENNYVQFANKFWRIIRVNGDGSLRMIYDGEQAYANGVSDEGRVALTGIVFNTNYNDAKYVGYMYGPEGEAASTSYAEATENKVSSNIKIQVDNWYKTNIVDAGYSKYISDEVFCNDRSISSTPGTWWDTEGTNIGYGSNVTAYGGFSRFLTTSGSWSSIPVPKFACTNKNDVFTVSDMSKGNGALTYPVGLITADEIVAAGSGKGGTANSSYYLYKGSWYWSLSPGNMYANGYAHVFDCSGNGYLNYTNVNNAGAVAPVINLSPEYSATLKGTGTMTDPYKLS